MEREELYDIAILSKLKIEENEVDDILKDLSDIINFANKINSCEVSEEEMEEFSVLQNVFREDEVLKSYQQEEILKNAKTKEDGFFYLKNVENVGGKGFDS